MNKISNIIIAIIITLCALMFFERAYAVNTISGTPRIIDGDTIELAGEKIRLACIDTPESNYRGKTQYCLDNETDCGLLAKQSLQYMIGKKDITCAYDKRDVYGRILGYCYEYKWAQTAVFYGPGTYNYNMIAQGYAWFYKGGKECNIYKPVFEEAKKEGYGLFDEDIGGFKEPKLWRKTRSND